MTSRSLVHGQLYAPEQLARPQDVPGNRRGHPGQLGRALALLVVLLHLLHIPGVPLEYPLRRHGATEVGLRQVQKAWLRSLLTAPLVCSLCMSPCPQCCVESVVQRRWLIMTAWRMTYRMHLGQVSFEIVPLQHPAEVAQQLQ